MSGYILLIVYLIYIYSTKTLGGGKVTSGGVRCSKRTQIYIYIYIRPTPPLSIRRINEREKTKGIDNEQLYGHGSQRGPMRGVSVPAGCRQ
jgi:hypothetical protein